MKEAMETSDIIIGILATMGVVVLVALFVAVVKKTFFSGDEKQE
jgi:hypothetical protein